MPREKKESGHGRRPRRPLGQLVALLRSRAAGSRPTPGHLRLLVHSRSHPSAEQMHVRLLRRFPTMSLATVYKTITLLKQAGEVLELQFSDLGNRYDGTQTHPPPPTHLHRMRGHRGRRRSPALRRGRARGPGDRLRHLDPPPGFFRPVPSLPRKRAAADPTQAPDAPDVPDVFHDQGQGKSLGECRKKPAGFLGPQVEGHLHALVAALVEGRGEGPGVIRQAEGVGQKALCGIGPG